MKASQLTKGILFFTFFLLIIGLSFLGTVDRYFLPEQIKLFLSKTGAFSPVVYIAIMALAVVISPIPSLPLDIAAGAFFGPILGTLYSVVGASIGAMISFLIARFLGRELIERFLKGHINFCRTCSDKILTKIIFFSRLLPFVSFDLVSYGAGLTKMPLKKFITATFFGMLPLTFAYNYFGSLFVFGKGVTIFLGIIMIILFFLIPRWIEKNNLFSLGKFFQHAQESTESVSDQQD
jgi:uncharacterized membrane protein YdjX (TVP38/TMEM64 family)